MNFYDGNDEMGATKRGICRPPLSWLKELFIREDDEWWLFFSVGIPFPRISSNLHIFPRFPSSFPRVTPPLPDPSRIPIGFRIVRDLQTRNGPHPICAKGSEANHKWRQLNFWDFWSPLPLTEFLVYRSRNLPSFHQKLASPTHSALTWFVHSTEVIWLLANGVYWLVQNLAHVS